MLVGSHFSGCLMRNTNIHGHSFANDNDFIQKRRVNLDDANFITAFITFDN
ncbi:hypothetical protein [Candidatus Kuenenia stuttgartiensis]|uniref:hypothetical protein n=1 Tax=Kuenenia stuttgartiensis TaxID=174633 RepID=UPI003B967FC0